MNKFLLLFVIIYSTTGFCQNTDTLKRQIEISGVGYKLSGTLYTQIAMGVNFPAKKAGWYNNLALSVNNQDTRSQGIVYARYSLSVGKSYQLIHRHFFATAGFNTGLFYGNFTADQYIIRHMGIDFIPKLEIGYNARKVIISTSVYFSSGIGYRAEYQYGEFIEQPRPQDYFRITGELNLYLKLILK